MNIKNNLLLIVLITTNIIVLLASLVLLYSLHKSVTKIGMDVSSIGNTLTQWELR